MFTDRGLRLLVPAVALAVVLLAAAAGGLWWSAAGGDVDRSAIWWPAVLGAIIGAAVALGVLRRFEAELAVSRRAQVAAVVAAAAGGVLLGTALVRDSPGSSAIVSSTAAPSSVATTNITNESGTQVPATSTTLVASAARQDGRSGVWGSVLLALLAAALLVAVVIRGRRRRRHFEQEADSVRGSRRRGEAHAVAQAMQEALPRSIDELVADPDPRRAICEAYAVLLDALATAGSPRRPYETPDEHLVRALRRHEFAAGPPRRLVELFEIARFSTHVVTEANRAEALQALREARDGLPCSASPTMVEVLT